jgi:hypothetical protein
LSILSIPPRAVVASNAHASAPKSRPAAKMEDFIMTAGKMPSEAPLRQIIRQGKISQHALE